jgi:protein arginine kinase
VSYEQHARQALLDQSRWRLEDKVCRAWGVLTQARSLSSEELAAELSWIRLGAATGILEWRNWRIMDQLFLNCQPAHLRLQHEEATESQRRDRMRADLVRQALATRSTGQN